MSPALAGGFLTTAPPGKPKVTIFNPGSADNKLHDQILCTKKEDGFEIRSQLPDGSHLSVEGLASDVHCVWMAEVPLGSVLLGFWK